MPRQDNTTVVVILVGVGIATAFALKAFQKNLDQAGYGAITTEIADAPPFYYAEDVHQQYLAKNPGGYCGLAGTGASCPKRERAVSP